ncbi:MAG: response regulator transcription factor [bacterium]
MEGKNIYVAVVEDKEEYRNIIVRAVKSAPDMKLVGVYENCNSAFEDFEQNCPDVLLLDIGLPDMLGTDFIRVVKDSFPSVEIIMLTVYEDDDNIFKSLKNGASGYILKGPDMNRILEAIRNVFEGGAPLSMPIACKIVKYFREEDHENNLTVREQQILSMICKGKSNKAIAEELFVTISNIKFHCKNIYKKMQVGNRVEAIVKVQIMKEFK